MNVGLIGITAIEVSKGSIIQASDDMASMTGMITTIDNTINPNSQLMIISFFSGFWGDVVLLLSFVCKSIGLWFSNNKS